MIGSLQRQKRIYTYGRTLAIGHRYTSADTYTMILNTFQFTTEKGPRRHLYLYIHTNLYILARASTRQRVAYFLEFWQECSPLKSDFPTQPYTEISSLSNFSAEGCISFPSQR